MKFIKLFTLLTLLTCQSATFAQRVVPPSLNGQYTFNPMQSWYNLSIPLHNHLDSIKATGHFYLFQKEPRDGKVSFTAGLASIGSGSVLPTVKVWLEVSNDTGLVWSIAPLIFKNSATTITTTLNVTTTTTGTVDTFTFSDTSKTWLGFTYIVPSGWARYRLHFWTKTLPTGSYLLPAGFYAWKPEDIN